MRHRNLCIINILNDIICGMNNRNLLEMKHEDPVVEEDIDFEISFYEDVIKDSPDFVDALILLGDAYTNKGLHRKALDVDRKLSLLRPKDPTIRYNLACDYALLKKPKLALDTLEKAIRLGFKSFKHIEKDPDLDNIRQDKRYQELLLKFRKK